MVAESIFPFPSAEPHALVFGEVRLPDKRVRTNNIPVSACSFVSYKSVVEETKPKERRPLVLKLNMDFLDALRVDEPTMTTESQKQKLFIKFNLLLF